MRGGRDGREGGKGGRELVESLTAIRCPVAFFLKLFQGQRAAALQDFLVKRGYLVIRYSYPLSFEVFIHFHLNNLLFYSR